MLLLFYPLFVAIRFQTLPHFTAVTHSFTEKLLFFPLCAKQLSQGCFAHKTIFTHSLWLNMLQMFERIVTHKSAAGFFVWRCVCGFIFFNNTKRNGAGQGRVLFCVSSAANCHRDARRRAKTSLKARDKRPLCTRRLQLRTLVIKITPSHTITVLDFSDEHIIRGPVTANDTLGNPPPPPLPPSACSRALSGKARRAR